MTPFAGQPPAAGPTAGGYSSAGWVDFNAQQQQQHLQRQNSVIPTSTYVSTGPSGTYTVQPTGYAPPSAYQPQYTGMPSNQPWANPGQQWQGQPGYPPQPGYTPQYTGAPPGAYAPYGQPQGYPGAPMGGYGQYGYPQQPAGPYAGPTGYQYQTSASGRMSQPGYQVGWGAPQGYGAPPVPPQVAQATLAAAGAGNAFADVGNPAQVPHGPVVSQAWPSAAAMQPQQPVQPAAPAAAPAPAAASGWTTFGDDDAFASAQPAPVRAAAPAPAAAPTAMPSQLPSVSGSVATPSSTAPAWQQFDTAAATAGAVAAAPSAATGWQQPEPQPVQPVQPQPGSVPQPFPAASSSFQAQQSLPQPGTATSQQSFTSTAQAAVQGSQAFAPAPAYPTPQATPAFPTVQPVPAAPQPSLPPPAPVPQGVSRDQPLDSSLFAASQPSSPAFAMQGAMPPTQFASVPTPHTTTSFAALPLPTGTHLENTSSAPAQAAQLQAAQHAPAATVTPVPAAVAAGVSQRALPAAELPTQSAWVAFDEGGAGFGTDFTPAPAATSAAAAPLAAASSQPAAIPVAATAHAAGFDSVAAASAATAGAGLSQVGSAAVPAGFSAATSDTAAMQPGSASLTFAADLPTSSTAAAAAAEAMAVPAAPGTVPFPVDFSTDSSPAAAAFAVQPSQHAPAGPLAPAVSSGAVRGTLLAPLPEDMFSEPMAEPEMPLTHAEKALENLRVTMTAINVSKSSGMPLQQSLALASAGSVGSPMHRLASAGGSSALTGQLSYGSQGHATPRQPGSRAGQAAAAAATASLAAAAAGASSAAAAGSQPPQPAAQPAADAAAAPTGWATFGDDDESNPFNSAAAAAAAAGIPQPAQAAEAAVAAVAAEGSAVAREPSSVAKGGSDDDSGPGSPMEGGAANPFAQIFSPALAAAVAAAAASESVKAVSHAASGTLDVAPSPPPLADDPAKAAAGEHGIALLPLANLATRFIMFP